MDRQAKERFVADRAKALAFVMLTRRDDLDVKETKEENGLDFTVAIKAEEGAPLPFGILLGATMSPGTIEQANAQLAPTLASLKALGPFPFPVSLFYFTVKNNQGYCTWGLEPVVVHGQARLQARTVADCRKLDDAALEDTVARVKAWYAAYFAAVML